MIGKLTVSVSKDMMYVTAVIREGMDEIDKSTIIAELDKIGVSTGILHGNIDKMLETKSYNSVVKIAEGKSPSPTKSGYYDFFFDTESKGNKPEIDESGRVHYGKKRQMVKAGEKLCQYNPPVLGRFGYTIFSAVIAPRPVKEEIIKVGKGVEKKDNVYYATVDGEIIYELNKISVSDVLVIEGDAKYAIDSETEFVGDVHVKGDVLAGVSIVAHGNIEIDGVVESCILKSDKDIIIHGGIKGKLKANILAKGSIVCPYIEMATVKAGKKIRADFVMDSDLKSDDGIKIQGARGTIIGGQTFAQNELEVDVVGNQNGVRTEIGIANPNFGIIDYCKVVINELAHGNSVLSINGNKFQNKLAARKEYHLVKDRVREYQIGTYVSEPIVEKEPEKKKIIMLVDDEPIILKTFFSFLSKKYVIMAANNAIEAKKQLGVKIPDLILLDYNMPKMNGAEFLAGIRENPSSKCANIPVIFVTAVTDKSAIMQCLVHNPQGYLIKPIGEEELTQAVDKYFTENPD